MILSKTEPAKDPLDQIPHTTSRISNGESESESQEIAYISLCCPPTSVVG